MPEQPSKIVARSSFVLPVEPEAGTASRIEDGYILAKNGTIVEVGEWNDSVAARLVPLVESEDAMALGASGHATMSSDKISCDGKSSPGNDPIPLLPGILLPGFVKSHGHDHESAIIGVARDEPLADWLDHAVSPFSGFVHQAESDLGKALGMSPWSASFSKARLDDLVYGITTALVHLCNYSKYHLDEIVEANGLAGTRLVLALGSQDRNYDPRVLDSVTDALARLDKGWSRCKSDPRVSVIPGPDQFFSNSPEMLTALKKWADERGTLIHIHSSEEPRTTEWFRRTYGQTPVEYGSSIGFLDERTLLAHQVVCTEGDLEIIAERGAMVVHNPLANTILGSGMPPLMEMIDRKIPVAISTDGPGSADNQNMIAAARLASQYQKAYHRDATLLPADSLLQLVTRTPARMLGLDTGALRPGFDADFILVDTRSPNMTPTRLDNCLENLFWAANGSEIRYVVTGGIVKVDDYRPTSLPVRSILDAIQELSERFHSWRLTAPEIRAAGARQEESQS